MKINLTAAALLILQTYGATAGHYFYSYSEWERLSPSNRANYLAGTYDGFVSFALAKEALPWSDRISDCIATEARMTPAQMSENLVSFVRQHPDLQISSAAAAFGAYLESACNK